MFIWSLTLPYYYLKPYNTQLNLKKKFKLKLLKVILLTNTSLLKAKKLRYNMYIIIWIW